MGLFDRFAKDKRDDRARAKNAERAVNKYAQSPDRMKALECLAEDGSDDALFGLLRRFGMIYDKSIEDEQEKDWVFDVICEKGAGALPAIKRYLNTAESISWPLRILEKIASKDEELAAIEDVISRHEPGYERDPSKKIQLLNYLGHMEQPRAAALIAPYLGDMDEGVRFAATEALLRQKNEEVARPALLTQFSSDKEDSLRIRLRIADGFAELGWRVTEGRAEVEKKLPESHQIDKTGHFKKKEGK